MYTHRGHQARRQRGGGKGWGEGEDGRGKRESTWYFRYMDFPPVHTWKSTSGSAKTDILFLLFNWRSRFPERKFLNGSFSRGFSSLLRLVFVWLATLIFPFYKMLFMNRLEFSFFVRILKTREEYGFLENPPVDCE